MIVKKEITVLDKTNSYERMVQMRKPVVFTVVIIENSHITYNNYCQDCV